MLRSILWMLPLTLILQSPGLAQVDDTVYPSNIHPASAQLIRLNAEASWGLATIPLPDYLRGQLPISSDQGLLVTHIVTAGPAAQAGVVAGSLLLAINDQPLPSRAVLPPLRLQQQLTVMCDRGIIQLRVAPQLVPPALPQPWLRPQLVDPLDLLDPLQAARLQLDRLGCSGLGLGALDTHGTHGSDWLGQLGLDAGQAAPHSLSVTQIDDQLTVSAVVEGPDGATRIELRGSSAEVARQLAELPPEIAEQLRIRLAL